MYRVGVRARLAHDPGFEHTLEHDFAEAAKEHGYNQDGLAKAVFDVTIRNVHAYLTLSAPTLEEAVKRGIDDTMSIAVPVAKMGMAVIAVSAELAVTT